MRTLIPSGGGVDSTALAYQLLRDTDDEIVLSYYREPAWERPDRIKREQACHEAIGAWFNLNMRTVEVVSRDQIDLGLDPDRTERYPVRDGFMEQVPVWGTWGRDRYATHADEAIRVEADRVALGCNAWDTDADWHWSVWFPVYAARTDIPMVLPFHRDNGADPNREPHGDAIGRFALQAMVPKALAQLVYACLESPTRPCGECNRCTLNAFYHRFCKSKPLGVIAQIDDIVERKCQIGRWRHTANPLTFRYQTKYDLMADPSWMEDE